MGDTTVTVSKHDAWVGRVLGVAPASLRAPPEPERAPPPPSGLDADQQAILSALARFDADPDGASPGLRKAVAALMADYPAIQSEMTALMQELDNDDLGAIDRAIALSRLGDLRQALQALVAGVRAAAN